MTNNLDGNASRSFSPVVAFRGRDLIVPKGIDGGEILAWASAEELLAYHLELATNARAFWKDGFVLYTLWSMSGFCGMVLPGGCSPLYPYTRAGFHQFLRDHGSTISPEEADRRIKVFRAYNRFEVTIIRMVEKAGLKKSFVATWSRPSSWWRFGTVAEGRRIRWHQWKYCLQSVRPRAAIDGIADCAAATVPLSSPAPSAHRCAAAGLDSSTAAERLASMRSTAQWIA